MKERIQTFSMIDLAFLLKAFAQAQIGGTDTFYGVIEKHVGRNHNQVLFEELYAILRSFTLAHELNPDFDAKKIFIKL